MWGINKVAIYYLLLLANISFFCVYLLFHSSAAFSKAVDLISSTNAVTIFLCAYLMKADREFWIGSLRFRMLAGVTVVLGLSSLAMSMLGR